MVRTVIYDKHKNTVVHDCGKTRSAIRSVVLPKALLVILSGVEIKQGYVHGQTREEPMSYSTHKRTYQQALDALGYKGVCSSYDFRTTYATELCEAGLTSKQVADRMGHSDTRMVDRIYARTRHESVMIHAEVLDKLNAEMLLRRKM